MKTALLTMTNRAAKSAALRCLTAVLFCCAAPAVFAQNLAELRWVHQLVHYTPAEAPAYDQWVIVPPAPRSENAQDFAAVVEAISHETNTSIAHIYLAELIRRPELQAAVMEYVTAQPEFQKHPPPTGFGRWEFKNSGRMRALVEQGLLRSPFVRDCNAVLGKHGKAVTSVSMEKLFFTRKNSQWGWDAIVWLRVDPQPKAKK